MRGKSLSLSIYLQLELIPSLTFNSPDIFLSNTI